MELLSTSTIKSFLRIEHEDDDTLIATLGEGAESYIASHLGISGSFSGSFNDNIGTKQGMPERVFYIPRDCILRK